MLFLFLYSSFLSLFHYIPYYHCSHKDYFNFNLQQCYAYDFRVMSLHPKDEVSDAFETFISFNL